MTDQSACPGEAGRGVGWVVKERGPGQTRAQGWLQGSASPLAVLGSYGLKKKEEKEAEEKAAMEQPCEGSLTRPKKAIPAGCGDDDDEEEESILDTVLKYLPGPLQDMFKK
uniref:Complexin-2 n=1 Tax=Terrapene triunguis TaxID=2587831 RepID=A0A674K0Y0_9SAUR